MATLDLKRTAERNVRAFTWFRIFFSARFYYPVYALIFLDYGLTLEQFGILNAIWAVTIVLCEVPSGALADTLGRRNLLMTTGVCMILEMGVLLVAPIGGGPWLFGLFVVNRVVSGFAEAAASGSDEALTYDSLKAAGMEDRWGKVLERVQRDTSIAFFFAMMLGGAVYDPHLVTNVFSFFGIAVELERVDLVKLPILMTFVSGLIVLAMSLRMHECVEISRGNWKATIRESWRKTLVASRWIWMTALPFGVILGAMVLDNVIRQFLTLASEYWRIIELPIASFGLIGSGMALLGLFVPRISRKLAERFTPLKNFGIAAAIVFVGLVGMSFAVPYLGILPAVLLYVAMGMMNFFVSRYLNEAAPSEQRATVLSFRGLSTNLAYGGVSILYALLIAQIKQSENPLLYESTEQYEGFVFVKALQWAPWYFMLTVSLFAVVQFVRFRRT